MSIKIEIPKNLDECREKDQVTIDLWAWAGRVAGLGKLLMWLLIIAGIIMLIFGFIQIVDGQEEVGSSILLSGESCFLYAFVAYLACKTMALLISALANIVENTRISARIALYKEAKEYGAQVSRAGENAVAENKKTAITMQGGIWVCPSCGAMNGADLYSCSDCGASK